MTSIIMLAALLAGGAHAREDNEKRTVIFTPGENEKVGQYVVLQQGGQNRFACIVENVEDKGDVLVFNGQRVEIGTRTIFHHLNVLEEDGYVVEYVARDARYLNERGKVHGPFPGAGQLQFARDEKGKILHLDEFIYSVKGEDGRDVEYFYRGGAVEGPFDLARFPKKKEARDGLDYFYLRDGRWRERYRDGRDEESAVFYCFPAVKGDKRVFNINGVEHEGGDVVLSYRYNASGQYLYSYMKKNGEKEEWYLVNGVNGAPVTKKYDFVLDLHLTGSGEYAYWYRKGGKYHVNVNGAEGKGYVGHADFLRSLYLSESGWHAYVGEESKRQFRAVINGEKGEVHPLILYFQCTENGKYLYTYKKGEKWHANINGEASRAYDFIYSPFLNESGGYAFWYLEEGRWHVNANGAESPGYGPETTSLSPAFWQELYFSESGKHAFRYKDDGKYHVNVNGEDIEMPGEILNMKLSADGSCSFYHVKDDGRIYQHVDGEEFETMYLKGMLRTVGPTGGGWPGNEFIPFGYDGTVELYSADRKHSFASFFEEIPSPLRIHEHIVIDGETVGSALVHHAWYDKEKNAFLWSLKEGKEIVLYERGLDEENTIKNN
jgi:hypothetical protein